MPTLSCELSVITSYSIHYTKLYETEYEEHRLQENLKKGRNLLSIKVSFSLASFDQSYNFV